MKKKYLSGFEPTCMTFHVQIECSKPLDHRASYLFAELDRLGFCELQQRS
jgi:hypothetical protein